MYKVAYRGIWAQEYDFYLLHLEDSLITLALGNPTARHGMRWTSVWGWAKGKGKPFVSPTNSISIPLLFIGEYKTVLGSFLRTTFSIDDNVDIATIEVHAY